MTLADFLDHLGRAVPELAHLDEPPADWLAFRHHCEARFEDGLEEFGDEYLGRDNASEGLEEAADALIYGHLEVERTRAQGGDADEALQFALIASHHFYEGHRVLHLLRRKVPTPRTPEPS